MEPYLRKNKLFSELKQDKYGYFPIWNQPQSSENDSIIKLTFKKQSKIRNLTNTLNDDFQVQKYNFSRENKKEENIEYKTNLNENISENVNKILNNVDKIVSRIKNSQEELSEINMNSLLKTKNIVKKSEKLEEPSNLVKQKEEEYQKFLQKKNKNKKSLHYRFLSDYYRRQLNKALLNFNPIRHNNNIKSLRKEKPEINEEFNEKIKLIEGELFQKTSPNFFRKKEKNLQKTFYNQNSKATKKLPINTKTNIDFYPSKQKFNKKNKNLSLPKIANFTSTGFHPVYKCYPTEIDIPNKIISQKKLNLFNFNQNLFLKRNKMRKFPDKEGRKLELELMEDVCKNMINSIDKVEGDNNDFFNNYAKLNQEERKKVKDNILEDKTETENILLKIKNNNLMKGIGDDMNIKRKKINDDIKNYGKQINFIRDQILQNIEHQESIEHEFIK